MKNDNVDLLEKFARIEMLLHRFHQQNHRHHGPIGDPHRGQGQILALLKHRHEMSQKELCNMLDMRSSSLGEFLKKLEHNGYIIRTQSLNDRRAMNIKLTEAGIKASNQNEQDASNKRLFNCLSEEEKEVLNNYLSRIILSLED